MDSGVSSAWKRTDNVLGLVVDGGHIDRSKGLPLLTYAYMNIVHLYSHTVPESSCSGADTKQQFCGDSAGMKALSMPVPASTVYTQDKYIYTISALLLMTCCGTDTQQQSCRTWQGSRYRGSSPCFHCPDTSNLRGVLFASDRKGSGYDCLESKHCTAS